MMRALAIVLALGACGEKKEAPPPPPPPAPAAAPATEVEAAAKAGTIEAWDKAAAELDARVAECTTGTPECREAARDAIEAHGRALALEHLTDPHAPLVPVELPARAKAVIAACDRFGRLAPLDDPEAANIALVAAEQEWRYGWVDRAVPRYEAILRGDRASDAVALAVPRLLEGLRRQGRAADMKRWTDALLADGKLMAARPELRELLEGIQGI